MSYKDTLSISKTNFKMRANLNQKEPLIQKEWDNNSQLYKTNKNSKTFILHDGPPYSNGNLHIGHSLNKILKDILIRHKFYSGYNTPFILGWDNHGLPIENAVSKKVKIDYKLNPSIFRKKCREYANKQVQNQLNQFKRLGLFTDFKKIYKTMDFEYEIKQLHTFYEMINQNLIYRDKKPVYWSPSSETALADAEVEYANLKAPSIYVKFNIISKNSDLYNSNFIVWTTTPWTLTSNQLLAIGKHIEYSLVKFGDENYILAKNLINIVCEKINIDNYKIIRDIKHEELLGLIASNPLYSHKESKLVYGHHVTTDVGTGIVHIASGFGEDDYLIAKEHNLKVYAPIDDKGCFTSEIEDKELEGLFYDNANKIITERLNQNNKLLKLSFITHSAAIDWRTKKPIIYRATPQWFISIKNIKNKLINNLNSTSWKPSWAKKHIIEMVESRRDWCISRQRVWGTPIIMFFDKNKKPIIDLELIKHAINIIEQHGNADIWFEKDAEFFLLDKYKNQNVTKEKDIMDVWLDSGMSHINILNEYGGVSDVIIEGNDQFRGWFNSSLILSTIMNKQAPYKKVITHGFVNDAKGYKMSKSKGNIINPQDFCNENGADILRLWVLSSDFTNDLRIGNEIISQIKESYFKIRNTIRFLLANTSDLNKENIINNLEEVDYYLIYKIQNLSEDIKKMYDSMEYSKINKLIQNFITHHLSNFYFDFTKDILYIYPKNHIRRRQVQTTMYYILKHFINIIKPVLVYTSEEVYKYIHHLEENISIHELKYFENIKIPDIDFSKFDNLLKLKIDFNKELEILKHNKLINKSIEAQLKIKLKKEYENIEKIKDLKQLLIVSDLLFDTSLNDKEYKTSYIKIIKYSDLKCIRCWSYHKKLYGDNQDICDKCNKWVQEIRSV